MRNVEFIREIGEPMQHFTRYWNVTPLPGESRAAFRDRAGWIYFDAQREEIAEWWRRLNLQVDLRGLNVLEVGCGHGALSVDALERGAARVYGVDLDEERIRFASEAVPTRYPEYRERLLFSTTAVSDLPRDARYDLVLSKDTFEHVQDLPRMVDNLAQRLTPGGMLICGFSPLFHSPWGDHGRYGLRLPWLHTLLPTSITHAWASRRLGYRVSTPSDLGLNGLTLDVFEAIFHPELWERVSLRVNPIDKAFVPLFDRLRRIRPLSRYFTIGIYAAFKRRPDTQAP